MHFCVPCSFCVSACSCTYFRALLSLTPKFRMFLPPCRQDARLGLIHKFLWDRFRSVRQDLYIQGMDVSVYHASMYCGIMGRCSSLAGPLKDPL